MGMLMAQLCFATIRRVGYLASTQPVTNLDYVNFQAAHDASADGDTIQLYPLSTGGGIFSGAINRKVVVIGPGYFTNSYYLTGNEVANTGIQSLPGSITSCSFTIDLGAAGSVIEGLNTVSVTTVDRVEDLNNIFIRKCRNVSVSFINSGRCDNWTIEQCYGVNLVQTNPSGSFSGNRTINNLLIRNSVIWQGITLSTSPPSGVYSSNKIYNCVFLSGNSFSFNGAQFTVQNSIFETQNMTGVGNTVFIKNITTLLAASNPISTNAGGSGNQFGANFANIFEGYPINPNTGVAGVARSVDARFKLRTGTNIAVNGGFLPGTSTATNCGIFGGPATSFYVLSGIPATPTFSLLTAPNAVISSPNYTINVSIRSN